MNAKTIGRLAEQANNLFDKLLGKNAEVVGYDFKENGADRVVNNVNIQSKYCSTGGKCISECFDGNQFRYYNSDGTPMQIEVPSDKYDAAIESMNRRIKEGRGPAGVKDAREIVRKGNITYEQAKNIAKAGTVESLTYDAVTGIKIGASGGGISAAITFAVATWNGKSFDEALEQSVAAGLQTGGLAWASSILVGQMAKAGVHSALRPFSDAIIEMIGSKGSAVLVNAFRHSKEIYGAAAMKSASKLLRGNMVTGIATVVVMSAGDVVDIFRGRISFGQLFKNLLNTSANVGGGIGGWTAGKASKKLTDEMIEDDAKEMIRVFENEWKVVAVDFLLNKDEGKQVMDALTEKLKDGSKLKDMYASNNRPKFAREILESCAEVVVRRRKKISLPTTQDYVRGLRKVLEKAPDGESSNYSPQTKSSKKIFVCSSCGYEYAGDTPPRLCGGCGQPSSAFTQKVTYAE